MAAHRASIIDHRFIDLSGQRFGRLTAVDRVSVDRSNGSKWRCACDCGKEIVAALRDLRRGHTKSCGCLRAEMTADRFAGTMSHGNLPKDHPLEYNSWSQAINRCHNPVESKNVLYYSGRGIAVCDRWRFGDNQKSGFACFMEDMGPRPHPDMSIDRKDNDKGYEPGNCRWATALEQRHNQRPRVKRAA